MGGRQSIAGDDGSPKNLSMDIAVFRAITDHYRQDLREFFTRSNFYLAVQGALLSALGIRDAPVSAFDYIVTSGIIVAGLVLAFFWCFVAFGGVFWIRLWRTEVRELSREYSNTKSYQRMENFAEDNPHKSPEEITKYLPWLFVLFWLIFAAACLVNGLYELYAGLKCLMHL